MIEVRTFSGQNHSDLKFALRAKHVFFLCVKARYKIRKQLSFAQTKSTTTLKDHDYEQDGWVGDHVARGADCRSDWGEVAFLEPAEEQLQESHRSRAQKCACSRRKLWKARSISIPSWFAAT
jgi:hypothetical protein